MGLFKVSSYCHTCKIEVIIERYHMCKTNKIVTGATVSQCIINLSSKANTVGILEAPMGDISTKIRNLLIASYVLTN